MPQPWQAIAQRFCSTGICKGSEIYMCMECYVDESRITPLLNPLDCLENHTQYICGTCGRCICIEHDPNRGLQRWNFPFKSLEIAKLYLRTADYSMKKPCGIYSNFPHKIRVQSLDKCGLGYKPVNKLRFHFTCDSNGTVPYAGT